MVSISSMMVALSRCFITGENYTIFNSLFVKICMVQMQSKTNIKSNIVYGSNFRKIEELYKS